MALPVPTNAQQPLCVYFLCCTQPPLLVYASVKEHSMATVWGNIYFAWSF